MYEVRRGIPASGLVVDLKSRSLTVGLKLSKSNVIVKYQVFGFEIGFWICCWREKAEVGGVGGVWVALKWEDVWYLIEGVSGLSPT